MATEEELEVDVGEGRRLAAFLARPGARPASPARGAAVLVLHEAMGLNDDMRRIARRFAEAGYVALAPDLLGAGWRPLCIARFFAGLARPGSGRPYRDLAAMQDRLGADPAVDPARIGLAGFCAGGGFAILYGARGPRRVGAIAPFYGQVPRDPAVLRDLCPTVASFGGRDAFAGRGGPGLAAALAEAGIPHDVRTYPAAGHSFMSRHEGLLGRVGPHLPLRSGYDEEAAEDAWARVLAFFGTHLAGPAPA